MNYFNTSGMEDLILINYKFLNNFWK